VILLAFLPPCHTDDGLSVFKKGVCASGYVLISVSSVKMSMVCPLSVEEEDAECVTSLKRPS
jgi:hypothetical protein